MQNYLPVLQEELEQQKNHKVNKNTLKLSTKTVVECLQQVVSAAEREAKGNLED